MMKKLVLQAIQHFSMLKDVNLVTVALSGGADSVALLHCLIVLKDELKITVRAAHLNHLIRGEEAQRDRDFCETICNKFGVEFICKSVDVPAFAVENGLSIELAARKLRYEFLETVADGGVVATAHTSSDNLETVILNLTRGTGIDGLCGIPPKRDIFIRPLIFCTRNQIEEYCVKNLLEYVTDSTNLSDDYTRNKIRHSIIPILKQLNSAVETNVFRNSIILRQDSEFLEECAKKYIIENILFDGKLSLKKFYNINPAIAKRIIKRYINNIYPEVALENIHIESAYAITLNGGKTSLPKNLSLVSNRDTLYVNDNNYVISDKCKFSVDLYHEDNIFFKKNEKVNNLLLKSLLDCDKIIGKYEVRVRNKGDKIRIANRGCTKTLTKLYNEEGIPTEIRDSLPVIADEKGVIWIYGIGVAQRIAVNASSKRILRIVVKEEGNNNA